MYPANNMSAAIPETMPNDIIAVMPKTIYIALFIFIKPFSITAYLS